MELKTKKILIIKAGTITISETFITDLPKLIKNETMLVHGKVPTEYGVDVSGTKRFYSRLLNLFGSIIGIKGFAYDFLINSYFKKFKPDVVLAQFGTTGASLFRVCKKRKIPLVVQFHGFDVHNSEVIKEHGNEYKLMLKSCAASIVVSKPMLDEVIKLGADANSTFLNPCGIDPSNFVVSDVRDNYFLSVGRFVNKKAPHLTILSFYNYCKKISSAKLIMIGDGPLLSSCIDLSQALGLTKNIEFLGAVNHTEVRKYIAKAFVFLQHSIRAQNGDSEGSPVAVAEAGACGIPVISTKHAGITEIVINGSTGILVDEKDIDAMTDAMVKLTLDVEMYEKMKIRSREHILNSFSNEKLIPRLERIMGWAIDSETIRPEIAPEF